MKQNYYSYMKPLSMQGLGGGAASLSLSSSAAPADIVLSDTQYYNKEGSVSDTTGYGNSLYTGGLYITRITTPLRELVTSGGGGNDVTSNWGSIPNTDANGNAYASGKRLVVVVLTHRLVSPELQYQNNDSSGFQSTEQHFAFFQAYDGSGSGPNGTGRCKLELRAGTGSYTELTYGGGLAHSQFNGSSVWYKFMDIHSNAAYDAKFTWGLYTNGDSEVIGNISYGLIVLDNVTNVEYINYNATNLGLSLSGNTMKVTSALNNAANTGTNATHCLKIAAGNASNIPNASHIAYAKGANEAAYTTLGLGDNGTSEMNNSSYSFGAHSGANIATQNGVFGNSNNPDGSNGGISGLGVILGLS